MIVIVTRGTSGDVIPMVALASTLRDRGNDVILITHCHYQSHCARAGIRFESLDGPEDFRAFVNDTYLLDTPVGFMHFATRHIFQHTWREAALLRQFCQSGPTVIVARHMSSIAVPLLCECYRLPMVTVFVNAAQANCFNLWVELCKSVLAGRINECRRELELPAINNWEKWANRPEIFLACWPEWFCGSTPSWPQRTCHAGFLWNDTVESGVLPEAASKALTASSKPILITGGTSSWRMAARFYAVAADACARAQCSGILVCPDNQFIPAPMPPNVTRFAELPFASVMPHVAAVIHHGGFGTMVRAMLAGIPQIIVPFGADRRDNAIRIERLGIGVRVAPAYWNAVEIASLIDRAMQKTDLTDNLAQARKAILADSCLPTACSDIEALLKP